MSWGYENQGTGHDPHAQGHEAQGRASFGEKQCRHGIPIGSDCQACLDDIRQQVREGAVSQPRTKDDYKNQALMVKTIDLALDAIGERMRLELLALQRGARYETVDGGTPARDALIKFMRDNP